MTHHLTPAAASYYYERLIEALGRLSVLDWHRIRTRYGAGLTEVCEANELAYLVGAWALTRELTPAAPATWETLERMTQADLSDLVVDLIEQRDGPYSLDAVDAGQEADKSGA